MRLLRHGPWLGALAGAATTLAFAPWGLVPLAILGPALLFLLWEDATPRQAAILGFVWGSGLFFAGTWWIYTAIHEFGGAPAWSELEWVGRELLIGSARLRVTKRTVRCPATEVNPETGERDADPIAELRAAYGHADLGIHAEVVEAGVMALGDAIEVLPE